MYLINSYLEVATVSPAIVAGTDLSFAGQRGDDGGGARNIYRGS